MTTTKKHDELIAKMTFAAVYPHYVAKVEKKGRTVKELRQVIRWLTGFKAKDLKRLIDRNATFEQFFAEATLNPNASLITGSICGYRIEDIATPLTRQAGTWTSWWTSWQRVARWRRSCGLRIARARRRVQSFRERSSDDAGESGSRPGGGLLEHVGQERQTRASLPD